MVIWNVNRQTSTQKKQCPNCICKFKFNSLICSIILHNVVNTILTIISIIVIRLMHSGINYRYKQKKSINTLNSNLILSPTKKKNYNLKIKKLYFLISY